MVDGVSAGYSDSCNLSNNAAHEDYGWCFCQFDSPEDQLSGGGCMVGVAGVVIYINGWLQAVNDPYDEYWSFECQEMSVCCIDYCSSNNGSKIAAQGGG